jgi:tetratricopeptide (TPR) repeat protein
MQGTTEFPTSLLRRRHPVLLVVSACLIFCGAWLVQMGRADLAADDNSAALSRASRIHPTVESAIAQMQARIARNAADHDAYAQLGLLLLQQVRRSGDAAAYARADVAFDAALAHEAQQVDALVGKGILALALHDFRGALAWAEQAQAINPYRPDILGIMTDGYVELGDYEQAITVLQAMVDMRPGMSSYTRVAYLRELHGDVAGAIQAMQMAVQVGIPGDEATLWAQVQLGHLYFNQGDLVRAGKLYATALQADPDYAYALHGQARVWAATGKVDEAIAQYRRILARMPLPESAIALGELLEASGDGPGAAQQYAMVAVLHQLNAAAGMNVDLELALFHADHGADPAAALAQAEAVYAARPTIYAADVLAWALYRNGCAAEAWPLMQAALRLGTQDARLHYHAGMIALALGDQTAAADHLQRALAINPYFSPREAPQAQALLASLTAKP